MRNDQGISSSDQLIDLIDKLIGLPSFTKSRIEMILGIELIFRKDANPYIGIYAAQPYEGLFSDIEYIVPRRGCTLNARRLNLTPRPNLEIPGNIVRNHYGIGEPLGLTHNWGAYGAIEVRNRAHGKVLYFALENKPPEFHLMQASLWNEDPVEEDPDTAERRRWWFW